MANNAPVLLPVDYKGTSPTNRISGEKHILNKTDAQHHRVIIPHAAPFYNNRPDDNLRLKITLTNPQTGVKTDLVEGVHYYPVFYFIQASKATMYPIYGGIEILEYNLEGTIEFEYYQALGGIWTLPPSKIAEILADLKYNPRSMAWDQIADLPERFPVVDHEWDFVDMVGQADIVKSIYAIRDVLVSDTSSGLQAHIDNLNNPHNTTKSHVGLGLVMNYALATVTQARAGLIDNAYMTPRLTKEAIDAQAISALNDHTALPNPHNLTPAILGSPTLAQHDLKLDKTGTAANSIRFAGYTFPEAGVEILKGTAYNSDRLGGLTLAEIRAETSAGSIENAQRLQGHTLAEVLGLVPQYVQDNYTSVAHSSDSGLLEGKSLAEIMDDVASATVDNSLKFDGRTAEEFQTEIYANLGDNLDYATSANFNDMGLASIQRMYFNDNRYFPIYRFNLDELDEWHLPPDYIGDFNHSFLLTPTTLAGVSLGTVLVSVTTHLETDEFATTPLQITHQIQYPLGGEAAELRLFTRMIGNSVMEIMIDRSTEYKGNPVVLQSLTISNISAISKFIARKEVFLNESEIVVVEEWYNRIPLYVPVDPVPGDISATIDTLEQFDLVGVGTEHLVGIYAKKTADTHYSNADHLFSLHLSDTGSYIVNEFTEPLDVLVKIR